MITLAELAVLVVTVYTCMARFEPDDRLRPVLMFGVAGCDLFRAGWYCAVGSTFNGVLSLGLGLLFLVWGVRTWGRVAEVRAKAEGR